MTDLLMGIPGVGEVHPGMHVCALFSGPLERDRLLELFMQEGQRHGDRCVCFIDDLEPASTRQPAYGPSGLGDMRRSGQLDVYAAPDVYLRAGGFSPQQMIPFLPVDRAVPMDDKFRVLRAAGQMSRAPCGDDAREFSRYESAVDQILTALPAVFLCMYDMQLFGVRTLANVLKIHSRVVLDGTVLYNPHRVTSPEHPERAPDTNLGPSVGGVRTGRLDGSDQWRSLTGAEVRIAELVGTGMTNRATADELIVSPHTVDAHLKHIYQKLDIHSRAELAVLSFRYGSPAA